MVHSILVSFPDSFIKSGNEMYLTLELVWVWNQD